MQQHPQQGLQQQAQAMEVDEPAALVRYQQPQLAQMGLGLSTMQVVPGLQYQPTPRQSSSAVQAEELAGRRLLQHQQALQQQLQQQQALRQPQPQQQALRQQQQQQQQQQPQQQQQRGNGRPGGL
jgi:hypothetical protein